MGKLAFVFAGQGSQYPGMGQALCQDSPAAAALFAMGEEQHPGLRALCFAGTAEALALTINTQPCLYAVDLACAAALAEKGVTPQGVAGFSLGELPAAAFAGVFPAAEGFALVRRRAQLMNDCAAGCPGGMAAVLKLEKAQVEAICAAIPGAWPVNYNCPGQTVVAFRQEAREALLAAVAAQKGRAMPLNVSGAFHSPCMDRAAEGLQQLLLDTPLRQPQLPIYANLTGQLYQGNNLAGTLASQVNHPVQWQKTIETMAADGYNTFVEVGPGRTLAGLIKKILPTAVVCNVFDPASLADTLAQLNQSI